ncbi:MAG: hypothetical protein KY475_22445 [Planctomycetes bacterium]|nr:hypothetical protein [Planctomycetota bacterium]
MEFGDFLKLVESQRNVAATKADIATNMAEVATKIANLGLIREQILKARLENIAKFLDIRWDAEAHADLLKARNRARREARKLEAEAATTERHSQRLGSLLAGHGSWTRVRDAWIAFEYFFARIPIEAAAQIGRIEVPEGAKESRCGEEGRSRAGED